MLIRELRAIAVSRPGQARERGVVLLFALILLVALTLGGLALMRSVSTGNVIAGNLSFQQAAAHSADAGVEAAITWLEANAATLGANNTAAGYLAMRQDPAANQSWDAFWTGTLAVAATAQTLPADAAGNTVSYVIQRMCNQTGQAFTAAACSTSPNDPGAAGQSHQGGTPPPSAPPQPNYRITTRVVGPRNTMSMVQVIVAM